jgi:anti-sigma factor RsiW
MSCRRFGPRFSAYLDGELHGAEAYAMAAHLEMCRVCSAELRATRESLEMLGSLPPLVPRESVAARVLDRLEMERRGPGLALLFRSPGSARPLMVPSLFHAAFLLLGGVGLSLALQHPTPGPTAFTPVMSEGLPEVVRVSRVTHAAFADGLLTEGEEGSLFFETRLARDGRVAAVTLLQGDAAQAAPVMEALRRERFEPTRLRGLPVAVSVYRLVSRLDVLAPRT